MEKSICALNLGISLLGGITFISQGSNISLIYFTALGLLHLSMQAFLLVPVYGLPKFV